MPIQDETLPAASWARAIPEGAWWRDASIALGVILASTVTEPAVLTGTVSSMWGAAAWATVLGAPLAARRVHPIIAASVTTSAFIAMGSVGVGDRLVSQIALGIALFSVGAWTANRAAARIALTALTASLLLSMIVGLIVDLEAIAAANSPIPVVSVVALTVAGNLIGLTALLAFGETSWRSAHRLAMVQTRTRQLVAEQKRSETAALAEERIRIARDLHDVVAHHISIIGLHAGAARLAAGPDAAAAPALTRIESSARDAVVELKHILTTLRSSEDAPSRAPASVSVSELPSLARSLRSVDDGPVFVVEGDRRDLRPTIEATLARVAHEAITNIRKHAGPTACTAITLRYDDTTVTLIVENTLSNPTRHTRGSGLGILGIRERAAAVAGSVDAGLGRPGYRITGGYTLSLVVPT